MKTKSMFAIWLLKFIAVREIAKVVFIQVKIDFASIFNLKIFFMSRNKNFLLWEDIN